MDTLEYEVLFVFGSVNVTALAYVNEDDCSDNESLEDVAVRWAAEKVAEEFGSVAYEWDEFTIKHTGTISG